MFWILSQANYDAGIPQKGKLLKFLPEIKYPALKKLCIICPVFASNHQTLLQLQNWRTIKEYTYNNDSETTVKPFLNIF